MAPFPEVELVTLDRLEVALKNRNMKLLKEGSYKLHEKYHSGHRFEHLDKLRLIYDNVNSDMSIPNDIKDILCPTIRDILTDNDAEANSSYGGSSNQNRVSSLTQLSYNTTSSENTAVIEELFPQEEGRLSAFDVFGAKRGEGSNSYAQSPFRNENNTPFQEFKMPETHQTNETNYISQDSGLNQNEQINSSYSAPMSEYTQETVKQESIFETEPQVNEVTLDNEQPQFENIQEQIQEQLPVKPDNISIFYCQDVSNEKVKNILRYRELISKLNEEHHSINEILHLISEINTQSNTNILELKNILDQLQINQNNVSLITNSTSANLIGLMEQGEYSYSLYEKDNDKQLNLIPVFGLSNQFICSSCSETYLDKEDKINPLVLQCPKCKNPMFPNFYTANSQNIQMNLDYYNNALLSLANSDVWVVIHPILEDKVMTNLLMSAIKLNYSLKQIYILDKDINVREDFKQRFLQIKDDIDVNTNINALEDFLNLIG